MEINSLFEQKQEDYKKSRMESMALPLTFTVLGLGAITLALIMAKKEVEKLVEEQSYDVENYDIVADKPFIYAICE